MRITQRRQLLMIDGIRIGGQNCKLYLFVLHSNPGVVDKHLRSRIYFLD